MTDKKKMGQPGRPFIYSLYENPVKPEEIENKSFEAIDAEMPNPGITREQWIVVRRMIHATACFDLLSLTRFSPDAITAAGDALRAGKGIYVDSNMIRSGISLERLKRVCRSYTSKDVVCHVADAGVADEAKKAGQPRSLYAVRKAKEILHGGIAVFGNAPVALLELNRMIVEEGIRPALVIAMPVGFVHVVESKEELMKLGVQYISVEGRRGGSTLAVSAMHSLCILSENKDTLAQPEREKEKIAVILLGHGSRVPDAGRGMEDVAKSLMAEGKYEAVETCYMSRLGPHLPETMGECVKKGVSRIVLIPYFLHSGLHMKLDIPSMMKNEAEKYPGVKIIYGKHLGFDEKMVEIVRMRINESLGLADIREVELDRRDKYPLPPGQMEYVPVTPEKAKEMRSHGHDHDH